MHDTTLDVYLSMSSWLWSRSTSTASVSQSLYLSASAYACSRCFTYSRLFDLGTLTAAVMVATALQ